MLTLICGLPNAGKTTYSNLFDSVLHYDDILRLSKDERMQLYQQTDAECIEGIYNTKKSREIILEHTNRSCNICIWIDTPKEECIDRENRGRPSALVEHHAKIFEPPTLDEGWDEIIIIRGDNERRFSKADDKEIISP